MAFCSSPGNASQAVGEGDRDAKFHQNCMVIVEVAATPIVPLHDRLRPRSARAMFVDKSEDTASEKTPMQWHILPPSSTGILTAPTKFKRKFSAFNQMENPS